MVKYNHPSSQMRTDVKPSLLCGKKAQGTDVLTGNLPTRGPGQGGQQKGARGKEAPRSVIWWGLRMHSLQREPQACREEVTQQVKCEKQSKGLRVCPVQAWHWRGCCDSEPLSISALPQIGNTSVTALTLFMLQPSSLWTHPGFCLVCWGHGTGWQLQQQPPGRKAWQESLEACSGWNVRPFRPQEKVKESVWGWLWCRVLVGFPLELTTHRAVTEKCRMWPLKCDNWKITQKRGWPLGPQ